MGDRGRRKVAYSRRFASLRVAPGPESACEAPLVQLLHYTDTVAAASQWIGFWSWLLPVPCSALCADVCKSKQVACRGLQGNSTSERAGSYRLRALVGIAVSGTLT